MFRLTLRTRSPVPLEVFGLTPERVASLSPLEVANLPVRHGNRSEPLGEFFDVTTDTRTNGDLHFAGDTRNVHGIAAGMSAGDVYVENNVGRHAGAEMAGGRLTVDSGAGDWLGAQMKGGVIEVRGAAGNCVGAAYRGSRRGMTGGTILLRGRAGDELGLLMRRGLIVAEGPVGEYAGASMIAGSLFLLGGARERLAAGMKRGTIVTAGEPLLGPGFQFACEYRPAILSVCVRYLERLDVRPVAPVGSYVRCYRGDLVTGGRGEVLALAPPG